MRNHSRHDQRLVSWFAQEPIDEHGGAGEVVNSPRLSFVNAEPVKTQEVAVATLIIPKCVDLKLGIFHKEDVLGGYCQNNLH